MIRRIAVVAVLVLACGPLGALADVGVRVATFNIENFPSGSTQFNAARDILLRIGADVVCLQEIDNDGSDFTDLANAAGYPYRVLASNTVFDSARHAGIMSKYPFAFSVETSVSLSGDAGADDLTRNYIVAEVDIPGAAEPVVIIGNHWKSGTADADEFRRSVESIRVMQITADYDSSVVPYFVVGDMNDDINDGADSPSQFNSVPGGMPFSYELGNDIGFPVANGVFIPLQAGTGAQDLTVVSAFQLAGSPLDATRPASGRRLDYLWRSNAVTIVGAEVYDSQDEGLGGLVKYGSALPAGTSGDASDHLLVFADISIQDDQSGACCTSCGCMDLVSEAYCLSVGGEFRGAQVACGEEIPPCDDLPTNMRINEVLVTHDGTQDKELVELVGDPGQLLCGLTILVIEGDGFGKGRVDRAISLDNCGGPSCLLDENGYFVAGGSGLNPAPDLQVGSGVGIFEEGTQTFVLVRDSLVSAGTDIDPDFDGVADIPVGDVLDVVAVVDGGYPASDAVYFSASVIGPDGVAIATGGTRCPDGVDTDADEDWARLSRPTDGSDGCLPITPGAPNPAACGGDSDGNGNVDLSDFAAFQRCFGQAGIDCVALELDGQCGVDMGDVVPMTDRLTGP